MRANILFVDDNRTNTSICVDVICKKLSEIIPAEDIVIHTAVDFAQAKDVLDKTAVDIILTDRMLPGKNGGSIGGDEVVEYVRNEMNSKVPIIVISAKDDSDVPKEMENYEMQGIQYIARGTSEFLDSSILASKVYYYYNKMNIKKTSVKYEDITLDSIDQTLECNGEKVSLTELEVNFLALLLERRISDEHAPSYLEITERVYPDDTNLFRSDNPDAKKSVQNKIAKVAQSSKEKLSRIGSKVKIEPKRKMGYFIV